MLIIVLQRFSWVAGEATVETIAKSLMGDYRPEHLFSLKQAVDTFKFYQSQIAECDHEIETLLEEFDASFELPLEVHH